MPEFHIQGKLTRFAVNNDGTEMVVWYPEDCKILDAYTEIFKQLQGGYAVQIREQNGKPPAPATAPVTVMPLDKGGGVKPNEEAARLLYEPTLPLPPPPTEELETPSHTEPSTEAVAQAPSASVPEVSHLAEVVSDAGAAPPQPPRLVVPQPVNVVPQPVNAAPQHVNAVAQHVNAVAQPVNAARPQPPQPFVPGVPRAGDPSVVRGNGKALALPTDEKGNIVGPALTETQVQARIDAAVAAARAEGQQGGGGGGPQQYAPVQGGRSAIRQPVRGRSSSARRLPGPPPQMVPGRPLHPQDPRAQQGGYPPGYVPHPQAPRQGPPNPNHEPEEAWPPRNRFAKSHERLGVAPQGSRVVAQQGGHGGTPQGGRGGNSGGGQGGGPQGAA
jgi:hypothetical protein